jgi:glutamate/tyrosine decarboxylase-like PLP-dependent enzyme
MNQFFNTKELKVYGNKALHLAADSYDSIDKFNVIPKVEPGAIRNALPTAAPEKGESFDNILQDTEKIILPNLTQWQHPNFHAYFPSNTSHAAIIGDIIASTFNPSAFTWIASPAATELENVVCDWIVQMLGLPEKFLFKNTGGGMITNTVGEGIFLSVQAAKCQKMKDFKIDFRDERILKFVGYYPETAHTQNRKTLLMNFVPYQREIATIWDEKTQNYTVDLDNLTKTIEEDVKNGLIPFWFGATVGSTALCSIDPLIDIIKILQPYNMWINADAAYVGSALVCPEFRDLVKGLEDVDSIQINFSKWMMSTLPGTLFFVGNKQKYIEAISGKYIEFQSNPEYLKNKFTDEFDVIDYKDWQIGLSRKFNSLKFWFLIRSQGIEGLQSQIRTKVELAKKLEALVLGEPRLQLVCKTIFGLVCFRVVKGKDEKEYTLDEANAQGKRVVEEINKEGKFHVVGATIQKTFFVRVTVASHLTEYGHLEAFLKQFCRLLDA